MPDTALTSVTFGLITDPHLSDRGTGSRPEPEALELALGRVEAFARTMNEAGATFVAQLGDWCGVPAEGTADRRRAALGFLEAGEARLALFRGPRYHVFGNHDTDFLTKEEVQGRLVNPGPAAGRTFFSFDQGGVHFVVLDAAFDSQGSPYGPGASPWDDANLPPQELDWLRRDLQTQTQPTVVLTHQLLNPLADQEPGCDPRLVVRNSAQVRAILESCPFVVTVFSGHHHEGGFQRLNGIDYLVLRASTGSGTAPPGAAALVKVEGEAGRLVVSVRGYGPQDSWTGVHPWPPGR